MVVGGMRHAVYNTSACCDAEAAATRLRLQHWRHEAVRLSCLYERHRNGGPSISVLVHGNRTLHAKKDCQSVATKPRRADAAPAACECDADSPMLQQLEATWKWTEKIKDEEEAERGRTPPRR